MHIDFLRERFAAAGEREALIWRDQACSYRWLLDELDRLGQELDRQNVPQGAVVSVEAEIGRAHV